MFRAGCSFRRADRRQWSRELRGGLERTLGELTEILVFVTVTDESIRLRVGGGEEECREASRGLEEELPDLLAEIRDRIGKRAPSSSGKPSRRGVVGDGEACAPSFSYRRRAPEVCLVQSLTDPAGPSLLFSCAEKLRARRGSEPFFPVRVVVAVPPPPILDGESSRTQARRVLRWVEVALDDKLFFPALVCSAGGTDASRASVREASLRKVTAILTLLCDTEIADELWSGVRAGESSGETVPASAGGEQHRSQSSSDESDGRGLAAVGISRLRLDDDSLQGRIRKLLLMRVARRLESPREFPEDSDDSEGSLEVESSHFASLDEDCRVFVGELLARGPEYSWSERQQVRREIVGCLRRLGRRQGLDLGCWDRAFRSMRKALHEKEREAARKIGELQETIRREPRREGSRRPEPRPMPARSATSLPGRMLAGVLTIFGLWSLLSGLWPLAVLFFLVAVASIWMSVPRTRVAIRPDVAESTDSTTPDPVVVPVRARVAGSREAVEFFRRELHSLVEDREAIGKGLTERAGPSGEQNRVDGAIRALDAEEILARIGGEEAVRDLEECIIRELASVRENAERLAAVESDLRSWVDRAMKGLDAASYADILRVNSGTLRDHLIRQALPDWSAVGGREVTACRFSGGYRALAREGDHRRNGPDEAVCVRVLTGISSRDLNSS